MGKTYYELLGVSADASTDEIERAYRERLKESHPDVSDSKHASERTKQLIEAKAVLADEDKRGRYDRLGHDAYVGAGTAEPADPGRDSGETGTEPAGGTETAGRRRTGRQRTRRRAQERAARSGTTATTDAGNVGSGAAWAQTTDRRATGTGRDGDSSGGVRSTGPAYAVERGVDALRFGGAFRNQRALVLLGTTFLVYPVLLFGALSPTFPLSINLMVAVCIVFVIAFLQSMPEVGMVVFGGWTVLLPPLLFAGLDIGLVSLQGILALTAVVFPFGLSALTRVAIRPVTAG